MKEDEVKEEIKKNSKNLLQHLPPTFTFRDGTQILHWAAFFGNCEMMMFLIESGMADVDKTGGRYLGTPVFFAVYNRNYRAANLLLEKGANVDHRNSLLYTPLHVCALKDDILGVILLLSNNASLKLVDKKGRSPLVLAKARKSKKVVVFAKAQKLLQEEKRFSAAKRRLTSVAIVSFYLAALCSREPIIILVYLLILWKILVRNRFVMVFSNLFSVLLTLLVLRENPQLSYLLFRYMVLHAEIGKNRMEQTPKQRLQKARDIVTGLVKEGRYGMETFCYTCLVEKTDKVRHCSVCNICIHKETHHCPFFERCMGSKDQVELSLFLLITIYLLFLLLKQDSCVHFYSSIKMVMGFAIISFVKTTSKYLVPSKKSRKG